MPTESLEIDGRFGEEYKGKYVFRAITWAKRNRIMQKHTKYSPLTGQVVSSDFLAIQAETIMASLTGQPEGKPLTLEKLLGDDVGVPIGLGELFSQIANRLNGLGVDESRFLSDASETKSQTVPSLNSESARNSGGPQTNSESSQPEPSTSSS